MGFGIRFIMSNRLELELAIQLETQRLQSLENSYPKDSENIEWRNHHTAVRDSYWRRRMLITKLEDGDFGEMTQVY